MISLRSTFQPNANIRGTMYSAGNLNKNSYSCWIALWFLLTIAKIVSTSTFRLFERSFLFFCCDPLAVSLWGTNTKTYFTEKNMCTLLLFFLSFLRLVFFFLTYNPDHEFQGVDLIWGITRLLWLTTIWC